MDAYLRGGPDYLQEDWLQKSVPIQMETVALIQPIRDENSVSFFNLLDNLNLGVTLSALYLLSFFGLLAFSFLINELTRRIRIERGRRTIQISKRIALALSKFRNKTLTAIGIFVLCAQLFLWLTQLFLTNNIKTNKVVRKNLNFKSFEIKIKAKKTMRRIFLSAHYLLQVVDTSQLIKNENEILSTRKVACMGKNDQLVNMIISSPTKNIMWRIFHEKTRLRPDMVKEREILEDDRCLLARNLEKLEKILKSTRIYLIADRRMIDLVLASSFIFENNIKKLWISQPLYEYNKVIYYHNGNNPTIGSA